MRETQLKIKVMRMIKRNFPMAWVWKISDQWVSGIPDLLIILDGIHFFIELKIEGGKVQKIQEYTINSINKAGGRAFVCRSEQEVFQILREGRKGKCQQ
jgi:hypothetical protein